MATIFVHVTALVSTEYAEKVAPPEHQRDFFTNIGRESGTTLQYETSHNCWQLHGDLEGINKAHRIMAAIQQLVNVPNYHCPAHAKKTQGTLVDDTTTSEQINSKGENLQVSANEDAAIDSNTDISDQPYPDVPPNVEQVPATPEKSESIDEKQDPSQFTPPKTRSRTRATLDPQVLRCESCGRKYRRKSHLLKHIQTKHSSKSKSGTSQPTMNPEGAAHSSQQEDPAASELSKSTNHYKHVTIPSMSTFMPVQPAQRNIQQTAAQRIKDKYRSRFCLQCQKSFSTYSNLERHLKIIHGGFRYRCFDCTKVFTCKDTLDRHNRIIHHNLRCLKCLHLCESEKERKRHVCANRRKERLKCEECHREYSGSLSLHKHYRVRHKDIVFSCEFCATACRSKIELFEHYLWTHNMYKCLNCQAIFAYETEFKEHKLTCNSGEVDTTSVNLLQDNVPVVSTEQTDSATVITSIAANMTTQGTFQTPMSQLPSENCQPGNQSENYTNESLSQTLTSEGSASQPVILQGNTQNETILQEIRTSQPDNHMMTDNANVAPVLHNLDHTASYPGVETSAGSAVPNEMSSHDKGEADLTKATLSQQIVSQAEPLTHGLTTFHNAEQQDTVLHMLPSISVSEPGYQAGMADNLILQNSMLQALSDGNALIQDHLIQAQGITLNTGQNSAIASNVMPPNMSTQLTNEHHQMAAPAMEMNQDDPKKKGVNKMQKQRICDICNKTFSCSGNLSKHVRNIHNNKERLPCEVCSATFASQQQLNRHIRLVHNDALFNCHCNYQCGSRKELVKHQQEAHGTQIMDDCLQCEICGKAFLCEHNLKRHMKKEHDSVHCDQCKSSFMTEQQLEQHKLHVHGKPRVGCELCPKTYKTKQKLREHILSVHTAGMPFSCAKCGKRFNRQSSLSYHWQHCDGTRTGSGSEGTQGSETESLQSEASRDQQSNKVEEAFQDNLFSTALSNLTSPYSADSSYPPSATPSYTYNANYNDIPTHAMTHSQMDLGPNPSEDNLYTLTTLTSIGELQGMKSPPPARTPLSTQPPMTPQPSQDVGQVNEQPIMNSDSQLTPLQPLPLPNKQSPTMLQSLNDMKLDMSQSLVSPQNPMLPQPNSMLQSLNDQLPYSSVSQYNMPSYEPQTSLSTPLGSLLTSLIHDLPPPPLPLNPTLTPLQTVNQQQVGSYTPSYTETSISQPLTTNTTMSYAYIDNYNGNGYHQSIAQMPPPEGNTNQSSGDQESATKSS